jgi:hypothetical protein
MGGLLFGLKCRRLVRACRCAADIKRQHERLSRIQNIWILPLWMQVPIVLVYLQRFGHRIALALIIIARTARIQPLMEAL